MKKSIDYTGCPKNVPIDHCSSRLWELWSVFIGMPCMHTSLYFAFALITEQHDVVKFFMLYNNQLRCGGMVVMVVNIASHLGSAFLWKVQRLQIVDLWLIRQTIEDIISCKVDTSSINICDTIHHIVQLGIFSLIRNKC